ncbi:RNA polymerase principal sigma factor HrdA [Gemmata sp. SH-PL17]|uniref:sigma-70 family RNA polymerase sigma factor n=1 Tax=Gemmata sp. SH-PL17 TaxID=1630693 RepID=UPI0004B3A6E6|nr:sigma-70 family RNA polymerase sigma factor [Gemmata sp. SH-PL17]AMV25917.1 RNA polymerase principal sigma factor HrdA [Gemmata sp. SH-PL17]
MITFKNSALKELTEQQTRFATAARRQLQIANAQKLLSEIESGRAYPYQYVCYRVTDYRSEAYPDLLLSGDDLKHDLAQFIRRVERSVPPQPIEQTVEPMLTLDEVSKRFNVSTKTISRWRVKGLAARRVKVNGRSQLGFPTVAVERFVAEHKVLVEKGARFSHLTDDEKEGILRLARELRDAGGTLTEVSKKIATQLSRSPEAVRYTIKNFDRGHPEGALYPNVAGPLSDAAKQEIYLAKRQHEIDMKNAKPTGDTVNLIAKRFGRARSSMYRVVNEVRAKELVRQPVDYIYNADFDDPTRESEMLADMPGLAEFDAKRAGKTPPKDVPPHMAHLYEWPLLTKEQEQHVFRKMNFLKHQLHKLQDAMDPAKARVQDLVRIDELKDGIRDCRDVLINCNQRLVYAQAKQKLALGENIDDLVSDGNLSLMRAVEKFDYGRGNKFSTYATWAIMKNFARSIPDAKTHKQRYMTGHDDLFEAKADVRTDEQEVLALADQARSRVNRLLEHLDARTREVIRMRTGLDGSEEMTLEQIGQHFGITKERVRQINVRGMKMLREWAAKENVEVP